MAARTPKQNIAILYPRDVATNATETLYVSERRFVTEPTDSPADQPFETRLMPGRTLVQQLFQGGRLGGGASTDLGSIRIQNGDHGVDSWLEYSYGGRRIWIGTVEPEQSLAQATTVYDGTMGELQFQGTDLVIPLRGKEGVLDRLPVQGKVYGPHATALYFNEGGGTGDRIELPSAANPVDEDQWTLEAWVRHERGAISGNRGGLFQMVDASAQADFYCYYGSSVASTQLGMWSTVTWEGYNLRDGLWHHVAYVRRGDDGFIYLDGEQVATGDVSGSAPGTASPGVLSIGSSTYEISAEIAEVRVWNTALSEEDIKGRRYRALVGDETGLLAYYRLNEGANVLGESEAYVFDSASTVAGAGYAAITGTPTWEVTGHSREGHEGKRMPLPVGKVQLFEPDLVDSRTNTYRVSSDAVAGLEVFEGGRKLSPDSHLSLSSSSDGITIADDTATDFSSGSRTILIDFTTTDLGATQQLYKATSGSVDWDWTVTTAGAVVIAMTDNSGASATLTTENGLIEANGRYDLRVTMTFDGPLRLILNGVEQGSVALPTAGANFNPTAVYIGKTSGGTNVLQGKLWSFAQWNYVQTPAEIADRLHERLTEGESGLQIGYRLNEGTGTTATDIGSEGLNGTIQGTWVDPEYTLVNDYRGCFFSLARTELQPIRCRVAGWLPVGKGIDALHAVPYDSVMQITGDFSVACWAKYSDDGNNHLFFDRRSGANEGSFYLRENSSGNIQMVVDTDNGASNNNSAISTLSAGEWFHIAGVFDSGTSVTTYVNGEVHNSLALTGADVINSNSTTIDLELMDNSGGSFAGMTQGVWLNRVLTQAEIQRHMHQPDFLKDDADLIGYWPLTEQDGDDVYDVGLNSLDGTANTSGRARIEGPKPLTATELSKWLVLRDEDTGLDLGDVDSDSVDTYEERAGSATVGTYLRDETHLDAVSRLIAPNGWTTFDADGSWTFGQLWAPSVIYTPRFDGTNTIEIPSYSDIQVRSYFRPVSPPYFCVGFWVYIDEFQNNDVTDYIVDLPEYFRVAIPSDGSVSFIMNYNSAEAVGHFTDNTGLVEKQRWTHILCSARRHPETGVANTDTQIFINGVAQDAFPGNETSWTSGTDLVVGGGGFAGRIFGLEIWNGPEFPISLVAGSADSGSPRLKYWNTIPKGDELGLVGFWPMTERSGTAVANRVSGGNSGTWTAEPQRRLESISGFQGDFATTAINRSEYLANSLAQVGVIQPTAAERVQYRERFDPYRRSELVGVALESPLVSSDMTRPYDELSRRTEESRADFLLAVEADAIRTALAERSDASSALDILAANYSEPRKLFVVGSKESQFGKLGQKLRVDASRAGLAAEWNLPEGGKDFIVTGIRWDQRADTWTLDLWG